MSAQELASQDIPVEFSMGEIDLLRESLGHSLQRVRDADGTPEDYRRDKLARIDSIRAKLAAAIR